MHLFLQVLCVFLTAVTMALPLAHALEYPGKLRLDKETYCAIQRIYYPGFTYGGFSELLAILATLGLAIMTPSGTREFNWTLAGFIGLLAMHSVYWIFTHPVNKFWLKDQPLRGFGRGFFGVSLKPKRQSTVNSDDEWKVFRDRWELSHVLRAGISAFAFISLVFAVAT